MNGPIESNAPLSPVLLAGLAVRPLPPVLMQPFLDAAMAVLGRRHPGLFERLAGLGERTFLIDPVDLPVNFLLRSRPRGLRLVAVGDPGPAVTPDAAIHSPLLTLIKLLEGKLDGDALFFSRDLVVEGDMEAVVALRNAVDSAGISLVDDLLAVLGPLARPARAAVDAALGIFARMDRDLNSLRRAVLAPLAERHRAQTAELEGLRTEMTEMRGRLGPGRRDGRVHRDGRGRRTGAATG